MSFDPPIASAGEAQSALALTLHALRPLLANPEVMELCINRPREAFLETREGWRREPLPFADFDWCSRLAKLVANSTQQRIDATSPLLSASLPGGERVQIVIPPATTEGCVAIAIRRPAGAVITLTTSTSLLPDRWEGWVELGFPECPIQPLGARLPSPRPPACDLARVGQ